MTKTIKCIICGKEFAAPAFSHKLTCSKKCSKEHNKRWRKQYYADVADGKRTQQTASRGKKAEEVIIPAYVQTEPKPPFEVKVGDKVKGKVTRAVCGATTPSDIEYEGTVIYIHPKGRFYTVEFALPNGKVRESFKAE